MPFNFTRAKKQLFIDEELLTDVVNIEILSN